MPDKGTKYSKVNVSDEANTKIDVAHFGVMAETGSKITKRAFIDEIVAFALENKTEFLARFQNRERIGV